MMASAFRQLIYRASARRKRARMLRPHRLLVLVASLVSTGLWTSAQHLTITNCEQISLGEDANGGARIEPIPAASTDHAAASDCLGNACVVVDDDDGGNGASSAMGQQVDEAGHLAPYKACYG